MKKRRLVIVAFMLATVLTLGVGYAAINGSLGITGRMEFQGKALTEPEVVNAVKFVASGDGAPTVTDAGLCAATVSGDHAADMSVTFTDPNGVVGEQFTVSATYTILYDSTNTALPDVTLTPSTIEQSGVNANQGVEVTTDWTGSKTLKVGETTTITVTVTYTNQDPVVSGTASAAFNVPIPFVTVDA